MNSKQSLLKTYEYLKFSLHSPGSSLENMKIKTPALIRIADRIINSHSEPAEVIFKRLYLALNWCGEAEYLRDDITEYIQRGFIKFIDNNIVTTYEHVIGMTEFWACFDFIPLMTRNKNHRIINNFMQQDENGNLQKFESSRLDRVRQDHRKLILPFENIHSLRNTNNG